MKGADAKQIAEQLKQLNPGFLPYEVFEQIARLTALSIIEFVPLRLGKSGTVEVLLLERGMNDPIWPGELHTPGTVIRPGDNEGNKYQAFERITKDELKETETSTPYFVGSLLHKSKRGTEHAQIYWVEVLNEPQTGRFYDTDTLPENLIGSQKKFINLAIDSFKQVKSV